MDGCAICGKTGKWYSVPVGESMVDVCEYHYGLYHTDRAMFGLELYYSVEGYERSAEYANDPKDFFTEEVNVDEQSAC